MSFTCLHCRCDADPATLARYVAALIKKDKPDDELRKICLKKLQIFLQTRKELIMLLLVYYYMFIFFSNMPGLLMLHWAGCMVCLECIQCCGHNSEVIVCHLIYFAFMKCECKLVHKNKLFNY